MSSLRILVAVKRVIDYAVRVGIRSSDRKWVETKDIKHSMNPFDEIAVEQALRIRESASSGVSSGAQQQQPASLPTIIAVSIGPPRAADTLRTALAMGVDKAIHVVACKDDNDSFGVQPLAVARALKALVAREKANLVVLGKQAIDDDMGCTGAILAGLLGWPAALCVSELDNNASPATFQARCESDTGSDLIEFNLPAVITADLRLNTPRFASLPNIMKAKKKPIETLKPEDLGVDMSGLLEIIGVEEPPKRVAGKRVASVDELIDKLRNEAKVIS